MKKILKIKLIIASILGLVLSISFFSEYTAITENPTDYINVYQIWSGSSSWKFQSIANFQKWNLIAGTLAFLYSYLNGLCMITKNQRLKQCVLLIDVLLILACVTGFFYWYASGSDHWWVLLLRNLTLDEIVGKKFPSLTSEALWIGGIMITPLITSPSGFITFMKNPSFYNTNNNWLLKWYAFWITSLWH